LRHIPKGEQRAKGAVRYRPAETVFDEETVIEARRDNVYAIPYKDVTAVLGGLPADFPDKLRRAIESSSVMNSRERDALVAMMQ